MHKRSPQSGFRHLPCVATCPSPGHVPSPRPRPRPVCPPSHAVDTYTRRRRHCAERSPHGGPLRRPQRRWRPCVSAHPLPLDNNRVPLAPGDLRGRPRRPRRRPHQRHPLVCPTTHYPLLTTAPPMPSPAPTHDSVKQSLALRRTTPIQAKPRQVTPRRVKLRHAALRRAYGVRGTVGPPRPWRLQKAPPWRLGPTQGALGTNSKLN